MPEETHELLQAVVAELRAVRRELSAIRADVGAFAEDRRKIERMQSPLMGVDLFRAEVEVDRRD
jgi:hypothetical protein